MSINKDVNNNLSNASTILYSLQHLIFMVANSAVVPVVVGISLGLTTQEIATFTQRTFIFVGLASVLQAVWGHRYPIVEGPAGIWYSTFIVLAGMAVQAGKPLSQLRTDLEMGLIISGIILVLLGVFKLMPYIRKLFNPVVNGVFLIIMSLQFSTTIVKGMLIQAGTPNSAIEVDKLVVFIVSYGVTMVLSLKMKGFIKSVAILCGTALGWLFALIYGIAPNINGATMASGSLIKLPQVFAWGTPTFDFGVTLTCVITGIMVLSNLVASVVGMDELNKQEPSPKRYNRTVIVTGFGDIFAAFASAIGSVPYASSIGFAAITGVLSVKPFVIGSALLIILGFIPAVGSFFASMPIMVGYSVLFSVFAVILGVGIKECFRDGLDTRQMLIIGVSIMCGNAVIYLPPHVFTKISPSSAYLFGNGMIVAVGLAILFEHVLFRAPKKAAVTANVKQ